MALVYDDDYEAIVTEFATNIDSLNNAFSAAWEKLMTNGGTFATNKFCMSGEGIEAAMETVNEQCPYLLTGTPVANEDTIPDLDTYNTAVADLNIADVFEDIYELLGDSQSCWPADTLGGETSYGGLFIRLAWHCSGSFRATDGEGGCAGGI